MQRANVSIAGNLAEGSSRMNKEDQSHFYTISFCSAIELLNQPTRRQTLTRITENQLQEARLKIEAINKRLRNLKTLNNKP